MFKSLACTIVMYLFVAGCASARPDSVVYVTVYGCAPQIPKLSVSSERLGKGVIPRIESRRMLGADVYQLSFRSALPTFWVKVSSGTCNDSFPVVVVPGHQRHILSFPRKLRMLNYDVGHWLFGLVPPGFGSVAVLDDTGRILTAATIDDGCYYVDTPRGTDYTLSFFPAFGMRIDVPVHFSDNGSGAGRRLDLSLAQIKAARLDVHISQ